MLIEHLFIQSKVSVGLSDIGNFNTAIFKLYKMNVGPKYGLLLIGIDNS